MADASPVQRPSTPPARAPPSGRGDPMGRPVPRHRPARLRPPPNPARAGVQFLTPKIAPFDSLPLAPPPCYPISMPVSSHPSVNKDVVSRLFFCEINLPLISSFVSFVVNPPFHPRAKRKSRRDRIPPYGEVVVSRLFFLKINLPLASSFVSFVVVNFPTPPASPSEYPACRARWRPAPLR